MLNRMLIAPMDSTINRKEQQQKTATSKHSMQHAVNTIAKSILTKILVWSKQEGLLSKTQIKEKGSWLDITYKCYT